MAAESIVPWLDEAIAAEKRLEYAAAVPDIAWFQRKRAALGYVVPQDGGPGDVTRDVLVAFQTRYRAADIRGVDNAETATLLDSPIVVHPSMHQCCAFLHDFSWMFGE